MEAPRSSMTGYSQHVVSVQRVRQRIIAAVHARIPMGSVPKVFGRYLDEVYRARQAGAVKLDGQNVFLYHWSAERPDELDVDFGVGATENFAPVGSVTPTVVPGGEVATAAHLGSYAGLRGAHDAIADWCRAHGRRRTGVSWEVYGHWTEDESKLRTDVFYLLDTEE
jgi:effector-binding domain-containing protein